MGDSTSEGAVGVFFDVDGTVTRTTIAHYYVQWVTRKMTPLRRKLWLSTFLPKAAWFILLDRFRRETFLRAFCRGYAGVPVDAFETFLKDYFESFTRPRIFNGAQKAVRWHQSMGHRVTLVSGGLEERVHTVARHLGADRFVATKLETRDGCFTGRIQGRPVVDDEKALQVKRVAEQDGINLARSYAYGDSRSDVPFLQLVGNPRVVGTTLRRVAWAKGWEVMEPW